MIEPAMILLFGALVGFVALAMLQAIYGINTKGTRVGGEAHGRSHASGRDGQPGGEDEDAEITSWK